MPERETPPLDPEIAAALRDYEREMLDGTQRSQEAALKNLRAAQRRLGNMAVASTETTSVAGPPEQPEAA